MGQRRDHQWSRFRLTEQLLVTKIRELNRGGEEGRKKHKPDRVITIPARADIPIALVFAFSPNVNDGEIISDPGTRTGDVEAACVGGASAAETRRLALMLQHYENQPFCSQTRWAWLTSRAPVSYHLRRARFCYRGGRGRGRLTLAHVVGRRGCALGALGWGLDADGSNGWRKVGAAHVMQNSHSVRSKKYRSLSFLNVVGGRELNKRRTDDEL